MNNIINASTEFIYLNKKLMSDVGLDEAYLFGILIDEYAECLKQNTLLDGYFLSDVENLEKKTALSAYKQRKALKHLQELNLVDCKVKGLPAKRYIKLNEAEILAFL